MSDLSEKLAATIANNCTVIHDDQYGDMSAMTLTPDELAEIILSDSSFAPVREQAAKLDAVRDLVDGNAEKDLPLIYVWQITEALGDTA